MNNYFFSKIQTTRPVAVVSTNRYGAVYFLRVSRHRINYHSYHVHQRRKQFQRGCPKICSCILKGHLLQFSVRDFQFPFFRSSLKTSKNPIKIFVVRSLIVPNYLSLRRTIYERQYAPSVSNRGSSPRSN